MGNKVIILGAGGHAKVIADIIQKSGDDLIGFLDDNMDLPETIMGYPYLGTITEAGKLKNDHSFIIGIGNNQIRKKIAEQLHLNWYTAIHPHASIAMETTIGEGTVVMANAVINASSVIGRHCIINTAAVIEHDNRIGDFVHISPGATLCGTVCVGNMTHVGAGVVIKNNVSVCENTILGAGCTVINDIEKKGIYIGTPAKLK